MTKQPEPAPKQTAYEITYMLHCIKDGTAVASRQRHDLSAEMF